MTLHSTILAAENTIETGNPILNIAIFVIFIVATMTIVVRATRQTSQKGSDFYTGGASFSGWQNGLAIAGDYLSAAQSVSGMTVSSKVSQSLRMEALAPTSSQYAQPLDTQHEGDTQ